jgi:hypothetical protein
MDVDDYGRNIAALHATDDAERRGDALGALTQMVEHPDGLAFWRPWRIRVLSQMLMFGPLLPRWATSRWILAQALQHLSDVPGGEDGRRVQRALEQAIELRGGLDNLPGMDPMDARAKVMDHDWVYRQLHLYELGGLRHFLAAAATADLVSGADRIHEWAASPMGGFRLVGTDAATITWRDLAVDELVLTANIGSACLAAPGECVIGRLVPIEDGVMFESAPLVVPEAVALRVALDPSSWLEALRELPGGTTGPDVAAAGDVAGLLCDVPMIVWVQAVCEVDGLLRRTPEPTSEELAQAIVRLARVFLDPSTSVEDDELDPWPCLAAALLTPSIASALVDTLAPADRELLGRLGELVSEPAASWCRLLARSGARAA